MPQPTDTGQPTSGIRLGQAIAQILAGTMSAHRAQTHHLDVAQQVQAQELFHERYEPTLVSAFRPLLDQLAESEAVPEALRNVADDMRMMRGQVQGMMLGFAIPYLIGEGLSPILAPFAQGLQNEVWAHLLGSGSAGLHVPLPAPALADMVVRGIIPQAEAEDVAKVSGTDAADLDLLVQATGEPPAVQELLFAYRRGFIDQARLEHGIRQGRTKNEWIDVVEQLRFQPMTPALAVSAAVQGHLSEAESRQKWAEGGFEPADWDAAYETAGRPPGPSQLEELLNRGIIDQAAFEAAVRESDVKDKYIPLLEQLRKYLPPPRTVTTLLKENAIDHPTALQLLGDYGVQPADAEAYLKGATAQKVGTAKHLAVTTYEQLYHDQILDRAETTKALEGLGYTAADAGFLLAVQDLKRAESYAEKAITAVHTQFVGHHISEQQARAVLVELGVAPAAIGQLVTVWNHEIAAHVRTLTPAQIVAAFKLQFLTAEDAQKRLVAIGYSEADATMIIDIGAKSEVLTIHPTT